MSILTGRYPPCTTESSLNAVSNELLEHHILDLLSWLIVVSSFCATGHLIEMVLGFDGTKGAPESMGGFPHSGGAVEKKLVGI